ncbi:MAG: hypothetical protein ACOC0Z_09010 [Halohasta sp.]
MNETCRKLGALWAIGQGLLTAVVPQLNVVVFKKMLGTKFDHAGDLEAKPAYLRQLRAVGIGFAAAGIATLAMERAAADADDEPEETDA